MHLNNLLRLIGLGLLLIWLNDCTGIDPTYTNALFNSPHEQYTQALKSAKLDQTALGSDWLQASERALHDSLQIKVPYRESGYFSASKAFSVGYRLNAQRGDRFIIQVETQGIKHSQVFVDIFALDKQSRTTFVAASKADTNLLIWEPRNTQTFLIRIQPELLRSGNYTITITREPALAFPVQERSSKQISSYFGASRDGGRRKHEGVDIFAPKGTPAIASADGIITGVGSNSLGGNVAFLTDNKRNIRLYYAHLDSWNVSTGQRVSVGDTIGFVGNTGNARTIAPHLHFGIYDTLDNALDPLPFIRLGRGPARQPLLSTSRLGDTVRVSFPKTFLRLAPASDASAISELSKSEALTIIGGTEFWLRVELPNGQTGYVASNTIESIKRPLQKLVLPERNSLKDAALKNTGALQILPAGSIIDVLAIATTYQLVRSTSGKIGWIEAALLAPNAIH